MQFSFPFTPDKHENASLGLEMLISAPLSEPSSTSSIEKKTAFKTIKRSVDLPFEQWAFIQTIVDINGGEFSFNNVLSLMVTFCASSYFEQCNSSTEFMASYQKRLLERLIEENAALYEMLENSQNVGSEKDV